MDACTYLKSCSGLYGMVATDLSDGRLCTNISPVNVKLIIQGQPVVGTHYNVMYVCYNATDTTVCR